MTLVRDAMQTEVIWLWHDQALADAAAVFSEHDIGGAPVCNRDGMVVGLLSKTDVTASAARSDSGRSVESAMTREVISVGADEPLERAISIMAFEGVHRLLVLDAQSQLAGIITSMDVLRELAGFGRTATRRPVAPPPPFDWTASERAR